MQSLLDIEVGGGGGLGTLAVDNSPLHCTITL